MTIIKSKAIISSVDFIVRRLASIAYSNYYKKPEVRGVVKQHGLAVMKRFNLANCLWWVSAKFTGIGRLEGRSISWECFHYINTNSLSQAESLKYHQVEDDMLDIPSKKFWLYLGTDPSKIISRQSGYIVKKVH